MKKALFVLSAKFFTTFLLSTKILAVEEAPKLPIQVKGQCKSYGYSYFHYDFTIDYLNEKHPAESRFELIHGFGGKGSVSSTPDRGEFHWDLKDTAPMELREAMPNIFRG